ncbi:nucleoporin Nup120/160 [Mycoplasmopsis felis]|uniref:nucleoporin Nup120/160 n=1 Tax=Mycoplasmopsis felis TaxID=33923 RepID=UPI0021E0DA3A|nr:nucleoporin Nup120/160 [Mycoplasmopsis felis]MCU9933697.1 nucleoporin Nup120/160 [Mycoplasmopsis felis]
MLISSSPLVLISCNTHYNTFRNNLKAFEEFTNQTKTENNPRYEYLVSLLEYTNQTMQKSFNQTNEEFIDISERSWLKFAANIEVRLNLYKELKKQLSELKEESTIQI